MNIEDSRKKLMKLFLKGQKGGLIAGIIVFTLIITLVIYRTQTKQIELLQVNKYREIKKNEVLNEISRTEKAVKLYKNKNILSQKDAPSVMGIISGIAKDSNVIIISIKPDTEVSYPLYIKYPFISVIAADSYHAIGNFISKIENQPDMYSVDIISIRPQEESHVSDKVLAQAPKPENKLIVNLILSIIAFKD